MSLATAIVIGLVMGVVFGIALEKSRVFEPGIIVGQMQLRRFTMLKTFLTAVATGAVVLAGLNGFGLVALQPKTAVYAADIVGGLLLGAGIALAGACPGTVLAQVGAGYRDALATVAGGILGAIAYGCSQPTLAGTLLGSDHGKITFADVLGIPYWTGALALAAALAAILFVLERRWPWRSDLGAEVDGSTAVPAVESVVSVIVHRDVPSRRAEA